jgi:CDP-6-deoxy-D-xylo-4-hexulose-3-dehydrase
MNNVFWIGVYPGLNEEMLNYVVDAIHEFAKNSLSTNSLSVVK